MVEVPSRRFGACEGDIASRTERSRACAGLWPCGKAGYGWGEPQPRSEP